MDAQVQRIGTHYQVLSTLGRGGMGVVYKAQDTAIGREVAIKMMVADIASDADMLQRFEHEARAAGKLSHPNIVTIYELGSDLGVPFIVMEFLDGEPLDRVIARSPRLAIERRIEIVIQVCRALDYAHKRKVIHRDIKPANVMILREGEVKLVDFGIARIGSQKMTRTGLIIGTISYMSPEQISLGTIDGRSDIFSTGVLLFEMLGGKLPFDGEDTRQTMIKILTAPTPSISDFDPPCPAELQQIIERALPRIQRNATPMPAKWPTNSTKWPCYYDCGKSRLAMSAYLLLLSVLLCPTSLLAQPHRGLHPCRRLR